MVDLHELVRELESPSLPEPETIIGDIEKLASIIESTDESLKKFAEGVRLIASDFKLMEEKRGVAEEVVSRLIKCGSLENSKIFSKLAELQDKDINELKILNEALKLNKLGSFDLGSVSDQEESVRGFGTNATEALEHIIEKIKGD